jgi:hypothetical protein
MPIVTRRHRSVQRLLRRAPLSSAEALLAHRVVAGIREKKSCHLREVARACELPEPLIRTERRLSKQLGRTRSALDTLPDAWLRHVATRARGMPYVSVDLSEIAKPHGRAFEYLDWISDRSQRHPTTVPGYWYVSIESSDEARRHLPLAVELYSTKDPAYAGWMETIHRTIARVVRAIGTGATWLFDRGFDDESTMRVLDGFDIGWVIRLKKNRDVEVGDPAAPQRWNVADFAANLRKPYSVTLPYVDKSDHVLRSMGLSFSYAPVRVAGRSYTLIAVTGTRHEDWRLLTNKPVRTWKDAAALVRAYLARWGGEEWIRCMKQSTGIEDVRVRGFASLRRMLLLAMIAMGIQALWLLRRSKATERLLTRVKSFFPTVPFLHYRRWEGTADALAHGS